MIKSLLFVLLSFYVVPNPACCQEWQVTHDPEWAEHPSFSPDANMITFESFRLGTRNIWIIPDTGGEATRITNRVADDFQPCWSPGGERIVFWSTQGGGANLWMYHFDGDSSSQLTNHASMDYFPKWSQDGSRIAFVSHRGGKQDIWVIADTGGIATQVTNDGYECLAPAWSPDGSEVAYESDHGEGPRIWRVPVSGGTAVQVTPGEGRVPSWSATDVIAFFANTEGNDDLYTINPDGTNLRRLTSHPASDFNAELSRDGTKLCFTSTRSGTDDVWAIVVNQFTRITEGELVNDRGNSFGCAWVDYDNDGHVDIAVANSDFPSCAPNMLYRNNGDKTFTKATTGPIVSGCSNSYATSWADIDNDGFVDACFVNYYDETNDLYLNQEGSSFAPITSGGVATDGFLSGGGSWADYDNDGLVDLFVANDNGQPDNLYRNTGGGAFDKTTSGPLVSDPTHSYDGCWVDYDNDGNIDLLVTAYTDQNARLFHNNGDGTFTRITNGDLVNDGGYARGGSWGDFDNDGDLDLFVPVCTPDFISSNRLYGNNGDGTFSTIDSGPIVAEGGWSFSSSWGDYDNDGDLDLVVFNADYHYSAPSFTFLYCNNGDGTFSKVVDDAVALDGGWSSGGGWGDYDSDGDLDLFITKWHDDIGQRNNVLYDNTGNANNWISIRAIGVSSNRSAIGAHIRLGAEINGAPVWQLREIGSHSGKSSQNSLSAHFGVGRATIIDSIVVEWPSGIVQVLTDVAVNQFLTIVEDVCCGIFSGGYTGNANCSIDGKLTLSDITRLVDRVYISKASLCCEANGNTNGDAECLLTLSDITRLIDAVYISRMPPAECMSQCEGR